MISTFLQYNFSYPEKSNWSHFFSGNTLSILFSTSCGVEIYSVQTPAEIKFMPAVN